MNKWRILCPILATIFFGLNDAVSADGGSSQNQSFANDATGTSSLGVYYVAFSANGGKGKMSKQKISCGVSAKLKKVAFKRAGWKFIGWAWTKTGDVVYKNKAVVSDLGASGATVRLYAIWAKATYGVAFYANGGKGNMATQSFKYGKSKKLRANKFKRKGCRFLGWATGKKKTVKFKNKAVVKNLVRNGKTVKLYAKWAKKSATASGSAGMSSGSSSDASKTSSSGFSGTSSGTSSDATETSSYWLNMYNYYLSYYNYWYEKAQMQQSHVNFAQENYNSHPSTSAQLALSSAINLQKTYLRQAQEWYAKALEARAKANALSAAGK